METRRLRRIKPQPTPARRLPWLRPNQAPSRQQNEHEEIVEPLALLARESFCRIPLLAGRARWFVILLCALSWNVAAERIRVPLDLRLAWTVVLSLMSSIVLTRLMVSRRQSDALRQLTGSDDLRAIGPLTIALNWPEISLRNAAAVALTRLLPRLQAADATLLDDSTRSRLYRHMMKSKTMTQQHLALAILKSLEQAGDSSTVHYVRTLASRRVITDQDQRLRLAARACLIQLDARLGTEHRHQPASRHSDHDGTFETRLRPTSNQEEAVPPTALRAGLAGETERLDG